MFESLIFGARVTIYFSHCSSGSSGAKGAMSPPPGPVKISHKNGRRMQPLIFHVSRPLPYLAAGSATAHDGLFLIQVKVFHLEQIYVVRFVLSLIFILSLIRPICSICQIEFRENSIGSFDCMAVIGYQQNMYC